MERGEGKMTIRDRIFDRMDELQMTQKEFSKRTGIAESTVSDWRKRKTNPTAEKVMIICKVLDVDPVWLLSGVEEHGTRGSRRDWYAIDPSTESGMLISAFNSMDKAGQARLLGYAEALGKRESKEKGSVKSLFAGYRSDYTPTEVCWGEPKGKEEW